jgi:hypothetical protein
MDGLRIRISIGGVCMATVAFTARVGAGRPLFAEAFCVYFTRHHDTPGLEMAVCMDWWQTPSHDETFQVRMRHYPLTIRPTIMVVTMPDSTLALCR